MFFGFVVIDDCVSLFVCLFHGLELERLGISKRKYIIVFEPKISGLKINLN